SLRLDEATAHPRLVLAEEQKVVRWEETPRPVVDNPKRFDSSRCVLTREGFTSGRHFWEVEVASGGAWAVGVAKETLGRKGRVGVTPQGGIWAVGQCGGQLQALTSPPTPISCPGGPQVLGVFLDYEEGRVVFVDSQGGVPIFSYPPVDFGGEKIFP
ncbi:BT1A1 protein, partial [Brachypteracias leptosomus]|nr:BT1A1 protein [Brachypteracias leptosomus]